MSIFLVTIFAYTGLEICYEEKLFCLQRWILMNTPRLRTTSFCDVQHVQPLISSRSNNHPTQLFDHTIPPLVQSKASVLPPGYLRSVHLPLGAKSTLQIDVQRNCPAPSPLCSPSHQTRQRRLQRLIVGRRGALISHLQLPRRLRHQHSACPPSHPRVLRPHRPMAARNSAQEGGHSSQVAMGRTWHTLVKRSIAVPRKL